MTNSKIIFRFAEWFGWMLAGLLLAVGVMLLLSPLLSVDNTVYMMLMQALQTLGVFVFPAWIVAHRWSGQAAEWLHLSRSHPMNIRTALLVIALMIAAIPTINCLAYYNSLISLPLWLSGLEQWMQSREQAAADLLLQFLSYQNGALWVLLVNILLLAVLPAVGEELTFRGVLQQFFRNPHVAVWSTAAIFSFIHLQFYGFVPRMLLGALFGYVLLWTQQLGYTMLMHATNNALSLLLFYAAEYIWHLPQDELNAIGTGSTWWLTAISVPLVAVLIYRLYHLTVAQSSDG